MLKAFIESLRTPTNESTIKAVLEGHAALFGDTLYHTTLSGNVPSILSEGLDPNAESLWTEWSEEGYVYMSDTPKDSLQWMINLWYEVLKEKQDYLGDITILKVNTKGLNLENDIGDTYKYNGLVEPERIEVFKELKAEIDEKGNLLLDGKKAVPTNEYLMEAQSHDYDAAWDYEIDENPDPQIVKLLNEILKDISKNILPEVKDIIKIYVQYIIDDEDTLAAYINGTRREPVFVINTGAIKQAAEKYSVDMRVAIETTLVHELAHAIQDIHGMDFNEDEVENFAQEYDMMREVIKFWERDE